MKKRMDCEKSCTKQYRAGNFIPEFVSDPHQLTVDWEVALDNIDPNE